MRAKSWTRSVPSNGGFDGFPGQAGARVRAPDGGGYRDGVPRNENGRLRNSNSISREIQYGAIHHVLASIEYYASIACRVALEASMVATSVLCTSTLAPMINSTA